MSRKISVDVRDETRDVVRPANAAIKAWVIQALAAADAESGRDLEVAVLLASSETIRVLNRDYRNKDRPTNVLSFPVGEIDGLPLEATSPLGDIVLCPELIAKEAREQGKDASSHWAHLCVHGALHLAGYDHVNPADAEIMEALEIRILSDLGIADPYVAR